MALTGSQKAYKQARAGIARSAASRSNYFWPMYGVVTAGGVNVSAYVQHGSLNVSQNLNEEPDTASFEVLLTDSAVAGAVVVGADVRIGLGGANENTLFGGRVLTAQTTRGPARTASRRSVMCADYLQVLDSEALITYGWPAQSATLTIKDLIRRFTGKPGGVVISLAGVQANLPNHASFDVVNERVSTVFRRIVTGFSTGGGFYVDALKVLHFWQGASEPDAVPPLPLTIDNPHLKAFAETVDGSQLRDAVIVEGARTSAPMGLFTNPLPASGRDVQSVAVEDASIFDPLTITGVNMREVRIGSQRLRFSRADGPWTAPAGTQNTAKVTIAVPYRPDVTVEGPKVTIPVDSIAFLGGRPFAWVRIDEQYLKVLSYGGLSIDVPRAGFGAMTGPIALNSVVTAVDSLSQGYVTQRYDAPEDYEGAIDLEQVRPQAIDSDVVLVVRSQTGLGIHEHIVQDGRYSVDGATGRGLQELSDFSAPITTIEFETDDLNARPGRLQAYSFDVAEKVPAVVGSLMILSAELTFPVWGEAPRARCRGGKVVAAAVMDTWLTDQR